MSGRKPWEIPIQYNDDRPVAASSSAGDSVAQIVRETDGDDIEEMMNRGPREERSYECNDTTPIDYGKGPHDDEYDLTDEPFRANDETPINYDLGPHDDEFGVDEEDDA